MKDIITPIFKKIFNPIGSLIVILAIALCVYGTNVVASNTVKSTDGAVTATVSIEIPNVLKSYINYVKQDSQELKNTQEPKKLDIKENEQADSQITPVR